MILKALKRDFYFHLNSVHLFLIFMAANFLLAYSPKSFIATQSKLWLALILFVLPWILSAEARRQDKTAFAIDRLQLDLGLKVPPWAWIAVIVAAGILRLQQALPFDNWPVPDEGLNAFFTLEPIRNWNFFYTPAQAPPFYRLCLALFFKLFTPSLFSMWLLPEFFSFLALVILYRIVRRFFVESIAFLYLILLSFSFYPLYLGKFSISCSAHLFWESVCLASLGWASSTTATLPLKWRFFILGLCTGLGFWVTISWPIEALLIAFFSWFLIPRSAGKIHLAIFFVLGTLPFVLPFTYFVFLEKYGDHIQDTFALHGRMSWPVFLTDIASNFAAILWGWNSDSPYRPVWGGMLNPLLSSLFLVGLWELVAGKITPWVRWILWGILFCMIPGYLSIGFDVFKTSQILPLVFLVTACGFNSILSAFSKSLFSRYSIIFSLMALSLGLDAHHLQKIFYAYHLEKIQAQTRPAWQAEECFLATDILEKKYKAEGPGLIFLELSASLDNQNFRIATFPYNSALNNRFSSLRPRWAAIILNSSYRPFLSNRWPQSQWQRLGVDTSWNFGDLDLMTLSLDSQTLPAMKPWLETESLLHPITLSVLDVRTGQSQRPLIEKFGALMGQAQRDPFLVSCLTERMLFYAKVDGQSPTPLELINFDLKNGYPLASFLRAKSIIQNKHPSVVEPGWRKLQP